MQPDSFDRGLSGRLVCSCGLAPLAFAAATSLKQRGEGFIGAALAGFVPLGHPQLSTHQFYTSIYLAVPPLVAAQTCFDILAEVVDAQADATGLSADQRAALPHERNNTEEKSVRAIHALQFAVENLDGHLFAVHRADLRRLAEAGDEDGFDALLLQLTDYQYFYPRCVLNALRP